MRWMHGYTSHIPPGWSSVARVVLGVVLWMMLSMDRGMAQSHTPPDSSTHQAPAVTWQLMADGAPMEWDAPAWPLDSVRAVTRRALVRVQREGYYHARIDSVATHPGRLPPQATIFVTKGPRVAVGRIRLEGATAVPAATLRALITTPTGEPLDPDRLEADIEALLAHYEEAGYPLARVTVAAPTLQDGPPPRLHLTLRIDEGPALWLKRVELPAEARTSGRFVRRVTRLNRGAPLTGYDPGAIRQRLQDTGLFRTVGSPVLRVEPDGGAVLTIPVEEHPPGTFDLALGYLPPAQGAPGQVVGTGHLQLENVFGGGRTVGLAIDRRPGRVSMADVRVADPYVFNSPVRVTGRFTGEQRDSTYSKQRYRVTAGILLDAATEVFGSLAREVTQPGIAGAAVRPSGQVVPRSSGWFTGLGVRGRHVDRAVNPRRGLEVEVTLERGQKTRRQGRLTAAGDTARSRDGVHQERLRLDSRFFVPTWPAQLLAIGAEVAVLRSDTYDRSDLFRLGGATTLRGYDEDRFVGNAVGRLLLEYRYQIDRASFAYVFGDLGLVRTPAFEDRPPATGLHPGYGVGVQVRTELGLLRATYALNPEDRRPTDGRIHLGLAFGL